MDVCLHSRLVEIERLQLRIGKRQTRFEMVKLDQESSEQVL